MSAPTMTIPVVPLPADSVLLPGVVLRIPLQGRSDIAAVLGAIYQKAASTSDPEDSKAMFIGCVPLVGGPNEPKDKDPADAEPADLFAYGTLAKIIRVQGRRRGDLMLVVEGHCRFHVETYTKQHAHIEATVVTYNEKTLIDTSDPVRDLFAQVKQLARELLAQIRLSSAMPTGDALHLRPLLARRLELYVARKNIADAGPLADFLVNILDCSHDDHLRVLAAVSVRLRLQHMVHILQAKLNTIQDKSSKSTVLTRTQGDDDENAGQKIQNLPALIVSNNRHQGHHHDQEEEEEEEEDDSSLLRRRLDDARLPEYVRSVADKELKRLAVLNPSSSEYPVTLRYLGVLADMPWSKSTQDKLDFGAIQRAREQLDADHYGLKDVKKRVIQHIAVLCLKNRTLEGKTASIENPSTALVKRDDPPTPAVSIIKSQHTINRAPIILLSGPPGTGKTSVAKSIATALGRQFHRISLGGIWDEGEIRGLRKSFVSAMPGAIVKALIKTGVSNPVILLDEIDKLGERNQHGDPAAALLEALDPEQNHTFTDHYLDLPVDLSRCLFIATANDTYRIMPALLDRMDVIELEGYTHSEKKQIATKYLVPKQIISNGLVPDQIDLSDDLIDSIISNYTLEDGVRGLERSIAAICRHKAVELVDTTMSEPTSTYNPRVLTDQLYDILGQQRIEHSLASETARPGIVTGLCVISHVTGSIMFVEVSDMAGKGDIVQTGLISQMFEESCQVALSWVRANALNLGITQNPEENIMDRTSLHIHFPEGGTPKDGNSAGLATTLAIVSLFLNKPVAPTIAMTGEISLRGLALPIGGVRAKLMGAMRAGIKKVLVPLKNKRDVDELPEEIKRGLDIVLVSTMWQVLQAVWPDASFATGHTSFAQLESKL